MPCLYWQAVDEIVGEIVEPCSAAVLAPFFVGFEVVGDDFYLLRVVAWIGDPALAEGHDGFEVFLKTGEGEEALVVGGDEVDAAAEAVELEVELGEVEAVATYGLHVFQCAVEVGVVGEAVAIGDSEPEDVVFGIG